MLMFGAGPVGVAGASPEGQSVVCRRFSQAGAAMRPPFVAADSSSTAQELTQTLGEYLCK